MLYSLLGIIVDTTSILFFSEIESWFIGCYIVLKINAMIPSLPWSQGSYVTNFWPVRYKSSVVWDFWEFSLEERGRALFIPFPIQDMHVMTKAQQPFCSMRLKALWIVLWSDVCGTTMPILDTTPGLSLYKRKLHLCLLKATVILKFCVTAIKPNLS